MGVSGLTGHCKELCEQTHFIAWTIKTQVSLVRSLTMYFPWNPLFMETLWDLISVSENRLHALLELF